MNKKTIVVTALVVIPLALMAVGVFWYSAKQMLVATHPPITKGVISFTTPPSTATASSSATTASQTASSSTSWLASVKRTSPEVVSIPSSSSIPEKLQGKVAFMQNGEVWVAYDDGSNQLQLTQTKGSISKGTNGNFFTFSPDFHYLAYIAGSTVTILDLYKNQVIQQITTETIKQFKAITIRTEYQTPYVSFQNWVSDDQFIWLAWGLDGPGGGADVAGRLLVDLQKGTTTLMQP